MNRLYFRLSLMRERQVLEAYSRRFHGFALDANLIELYGNAVGTFLAKLAKPYFVDPVLYKFASPFYSEHSGKRWDEPLSSTYRIDGLLASRTEGLQASDLENQPYINGIVSATLDYQRNRVPDLSQELAALAFLAGTPLNALGPPEFLVAPYLYVEDARSLMANVKLAAHAASIRKSGEKLYAVVSIPRDWLDSPTRTQTIAQEYAKLAIDGYLLWVGNFRDWEEDSSLLESFAGFVKVLSSSGREVVNMFGGYYSTILTARKLLGASVQGVGISEFRDPTGPAGGGVKRYYVPAAHQSVSVDLATDLRSADPKLFSCGCSLCASGAMPNTLSVLQLAQHYMEVRLKEFDTAASAKSVQLVMSDLEQTKQAMSKVKTPRIADSFVRRLDTWGTTLRELVAAGVLS